MITKVLLTVFLMTGVAMIAFAWNGFGQAEINYPPGQPLPGVIAALAISGCLIAGKVMKERIKQ